MYNALAGKVGQKKVSKRAQTAGWQLWGWNESDSKRTRAGPASAMSDHG